MAFWVAFFVSLALTVVGELLRPKQSPPNAKASGIDEFDIPTAEAGRILTVFVGKVKITGSNVTYYGDLLVQPLKQKVKTGMFSSKQQTYAYKYYLGMQHVLGFGRSDVKLHNIYFGDYTQTPKHTVSENQPDGSTLYTFDDENFYGGNKEEGGIKGRMRFYPGSDTQQANAYLSGVLKEPFPAYQGIVHVILERMYLGTQKFIKPLSFVLSSYPNQLGLTDNKHIIGEDSNPVCFIYEVLTERVWGVGKSQTDIDIEQFRKIGNQVYDEGFGMSMIYNGASSAEDLIGDILRHIDGVVFTDVETGLLTIRLARHDYVKADLPVYRNDDSSDQYVEPIRFSRPSWSETKNTLKVSYTDREKDYIAGLYTVQDLANATQRGGEQAVESVDFSGFCTKAAVQMAAARALRTYAYPLAKATLVLSRKAWRTKPADVIRVVWPELGLNDVAMRVTSVAYGTIRQNRVTLEVVEDIFSIAESAFGEPPSSDWVDPVGLPLPMARQAIAEMPFFLQRVDGANIMTLGTRANNLDLGFHIQMGGSVQTLQSVSDDSEFSASGVLGAAYPANSSAGFVVAALLGADEGEVNFLPDDSAVAGGETLTLLKSATTEEYVTYRNVDLANGVFTGVQRGLFDTLPQTHPLGTQVWFLSSGFAVANQQPILAGFPLLQYVRLLPVNPRGAVDPEDATPMAITLVNRAFRPYAPGQIRIDGVRPSQIVDEVQGPFTLTWAHRNRNVERIVSQDEDSVEPEAGVTYTIRLYDSVGGLIIEKTGINNTATAASISTRYGGPLTVEIFSVRDNAESLYRQKFLIQHNSTGITEDMITADEATYVIDGGAP